MPGKSLLTLIGENNYMQSARKKYVFQYISIKIFLLLIFIVGFSCSVVAGFQNTDILSNADSDSSEVFVNFNDVEIKLYKVIKLADSLSKVNKKQAYELIKKNKYLIKSDNLKPYLLASYYHIYGRLLVDNRKPKSGFDTLKLALDLKTSIYGKTDNKLAKTYNYMGVANFHMHNFEEALNNYQNAVNILLLNKFFGRDLFDAYQNIGIVKASLGNFEKAYSYFTDASNIIEQTDSHDSLLLAGFYSNYGLLAGLMGKSDDANTYFDISEKYYIGLYGDQYMKLANLNLNRGVNTFRNLNYTLSSIYHRNAVEIYLNNNQIGKGLLKCLSNLCVLYMELDDLQLSLEYGYKALSYNPPVDMRIAIYQHLAKTYEILEDYDKAREKFNLALEITKESDYNPVRKYDLYLHYADFLISTKYEDQGYYYYKLALDIEGDLSGYKTKKYAIVLSKIGAYFLAVDPDPDNALHYFNRSIDIWKEQTQQNNKGNISESFHDIRFAAAYRDKSKALIKRYEVEGKIEDLFESLDNYEWLLEQLERISRSLQKENQEIIRGLIYPIYNEAIDLSFMLYELSSSDYYQKKVFSFSEKSKSAILLSSIQNMNALKTSDLPKELLLLDQNLNEEINSVRKQLFDEKQQNKSNKKRISFFESRLVQLLLTHDSLVLKLEKNYPKYYSLKYDLSIIEFNELNRKLSDNEAIVEYQLSDSYLYIFTIRSKKLFTHRIEIDSTFYESLNYFIELKNTDLTMQNRSDFNRFILHSNRLYDFLIQPVYQYLKDKKLIIIPSGLLGYLPFEILVKSGGKVKELDFKNLDYLVREFPISYSYSSTLRFSPYFNSSNYKTNLNILYMAPQYASIRYDNQLISRNKSVFKELPNAQREVTELQLEFGGKTLSGKDALKSTFLNTASNYDILHLAMHTLINDSLPMYSKLVFAQEGYDDEERFLNTSDIYELNLKAAMVTLSSCNTGTGVLKKGEGIMSLARGFVFAGVPSVVMTLWEVPDESGLKIMKAFYTYLSDGLSKDDAMRLAKLDQLNSANMIKSHPNFWSAYIVTGDTAVLNIVDDRNNVWIMLFFVIPFLIVFLLYRRVVKNID